MKKNNVVIVNFNQASPGIGCIIREFSKALSIRGYEVSIVNSLSSVTKDDSSIFIPYGPKEAYILLKNGFSCKFSLMVDYYSLGLKNRALFYLKHGKFLYREFWRSLLGFFLYYYREQYIFSNIKNFMLVSEYDISLLKRRFPNNHFIFCPNGVDLPVYNKSYTSDNNRLNLGILSHWNKLTLSECQWFIEDIMPKIVKDYPFARLIIAGRGADESIRKYFTSIPFIDFIGEVDMLDSFFDKIDIYVATVPKSCGILNKVLDSFAYKKLVIGTSASFSGFLNMTNSYLICENISDYLKAISIYFNDKNYVNQLIENSYNYIITHNNWSLNYNKLIDELEMFSVLE